MLLMRGCLPSEYFPDHMQLDDLTKLWDQARENCQAQNADLLIINDHLENHWIYDFANENDIDVWLGLRENVSFLMFLFMMDPTSDPFEQDFMSTPQQT